MVISPWLFTRGHLYDWDFLDFSQSGSIGDTIGGITAPIVGLVSILLLWWTLRAQMDFNAKQDAINKEQQKFNDANRILAMESHILHLDENLNYAFTVLGNTLEGHGISSLKLLVGGPDRDIVVVREELEHVIDRVHVIDIALCSMVQYIIKSSLDPEEKKSSIGMAELYLSYIDDFYCDLTAGKIKLIFAIDDLHWEAVDAENPYEEMKKKTHTYQVRIEPYLNTCRKSLAV